MVNYYQLLGVTKSASQSEIKKAYHKLALKNHPDKGGDPDTFKKISLAFQVLGDEQKRTAYDNGQLDDNGNVKGFGGAGTDPFDLFRSFFGGAPFDMGMGGTPRGFRQEPKKVTLRVSLEDAYKGKEANLKLTRKGCCPSCKGSGGTKPPETCTSCGGAGKVRRVLQLAPGMMQQSIGMCSDCAGQGTRIHPAHKCTTCEGAKTIEETTTISMQIDKGVRDGEQVFLKNHGDYNVLTRNHDDLVLVIQIKDHPRLKRNKDDLVLEQVIQLQDALTGAKIQYSHLDGVTYTVDAKHRVIEPNSMYKVSNLGMPIGNKANGYGNLYIIFQVAFPRQVYDNTSLIEDLFGKIASYEDNKVVQMFPTSHHVENNGQGCKQQ